MFYSTFSSPSTQENSYSRLTYPLFQSSFNENGFKFQNPSFIFQRDKMFSQDPSVSLPNYSMYCVFECANKFCNTHLKCCSYCGAKSHPFCPDKWSDCAISDHYFRFCPKLLRWLHDPNTSHHLLWKNIVRDWILSCPLPHFKT